MVYNRTITRFIANDKVVCQRVRWWWDAIGFRQLSTTSFEAFELEITVNYPEHTWTDNSSFIRNLTRWSVTFWLVHMTEHKVLPGSIATRRIRSIAAWSPVNCTRLVDALKQTVDASNFPTIVRKSTQRPLCTISFWQIKIILYKSESHLPV